MIQCMILYSISVKSCFIGLYQCMIGFFMYILVISSKYHNIRILSLVLK